jgi:hypothetical protein
MNLLETVQQNLNYPVLQKIDTTTSKIVDDITTPEQDKFSQAAIPAVLTALYKYVQSDAGAEALILADEGTKWITLLFDEHKKDAIQMIASYSKQSNEDPLHKMNIIATEAVKITKQNIGDKANIQDVKLYYKGQKNDILLYLLPELKMGELLNDGTLDDNTHKMEGPISSFMQNLGNVFDTPNTETKPTEKDTSL